MKDTNNEARAREFSRRRKETHNIIRVKKRKYLIRIIEDADPDFRLNRTLDMYKRVNSLKRDFKKKKRFLRLMMESSKPQKRKQLKDLDNILINC